jgi:1-hydroxycarotenoid 3,4-desaturase
MRAPTPSRAAVAAAAMTRPALWPWLRPGRSLASALAAAFRDPRLAQLFGRYATYVGGAPALSPAVLALIWRAEERGVWAVEGGMGRLAGAMAALAEDCGARLRYGTRAEHIIAREGAVAAVAIAGGEVLPARHVVFNGDPAALRAGLLGPDVLRAVPESATEPRSHSAWVWSFAARATGLHLALHNVFFGADPRREFPPIAGGRMPEDPSLYICAQDRARGIVPDGAERFEIIMNAPPSDRLSGLAGHEEFQTCRDRTFGTLLTRFGLRFDPEPGPEALTRPRDFAALFPGSRGSIYGLSPHGTMAAFARPVAQTAVPGLWLAGGGAHPGAGVPMATLSGRHAAEAILTLAPRASTSPSGRTAMPGGTSTASRTTAAAPSRS